MPNADVPDSNLNCNVQLERTAINAKDRIFFHLLAANRIIQAGSATHANNRNNSTRQTNLRFGIRDGDTVVLERLRDAGVARGRDGVATRNSPTAFSGIRVGRRDGEPREADNSCER